VFVYDSSRSQVNLDDQGKFGRTSDENWLRKDLELSVKIEAKTLGSYVNRIDRVFIATRTKRSQPNRVLVGGDLALVKIDRREIDATW
jgi:hypothetical protein